MGAPAVEPPNNSTWRSSAPAGTTEQMLSAAVTRRGRAAGALCGAGARRACTLQVQLHWMSLRTSADSVGCTVYGGCAQSVPQTTVNTYRYRLQ